MAKGKAAATARIQTPTVPLPTCWTLGELCGQSLNLPLCKMEMTRKHALQRAAGRIAGTPAWSAETGAKAQEGYGAQAGVHLLPHLLCWLHDEATGEGV